MLKGPRPPGSLAKGATTPGNSRSHGGRSQQFTKEHAEALALQGLSFLAGDADRLTRFLTSTGIDPGDLKQWDANPGVQCAVLDHLLADESLLLVFAAEINVPPENIAPAQAVLAGGPGDQ